MASMQRPVAGFSLLEVLIAIVVLSLGLLGTVGMLLNALRSAHESAVFSAAVDLARDLSEKVRINRDIAARRGEANPYLAALAAGDAAPASALACLGRTRCSATQLARWDLHEWVQRVQAALPEARIVVCFDNVLPQDGGDAWSCRQSGHTLVVKLGWAPRSGRETAHDRRNRTPRVVMQIVPGQSDGDAAVGR